MVVIGDVDEFVVSELVEVFVYGAVDVSELVEVFVYGAVDCFYSQVSCFLWVCKDGV